MKNFFLTILSSLNPSQPTTLVSINPSQGYQLIGEVRISSRNDIDAQVAKARAAQPAWAAVSLQERIAHLERVYTILCQHREEIGALTCKEMGMPISILYRIDIDSGLAYLRGYLDQAPQWLAPEVVYESDDERHVMLFEARGVAGVVTAWNYPFCNFIWAVMQNLIVGNTVVFKHSEECPLTGVLLESLMQSADLPDGVFNCVHGNGKDVGEYLMHNAIDLIHFTGSSKVGKHLYEVAGKKFIPAILELGGSAPGIVLADADMKKVVESVYANRFFNSGQTCDGLKRLIVHSSRLPELLAELQHLLATKKIGDAQDPATDIGPLVAERQLIALEAQVADARAQGATIVVGGKRPEGLSGAYYEPTIITQVTSTMRVWREEVFGPVLPIVSFETVEEAVALANDTVYGLGGYVYSQNKELAFEVSAQLKTGNISVNGADYVIAAVPFGGYKQSGMGREHGELGLRELCLAKVIATKK